MRSAFRKPKRILSVVALAASLFSHPVSSFAQDTVVFAGWGGSIQQAQREIFFEDFEKETGIRVIDVPGVQLPKIKAMVESGNTQWDVVQALGMWIPQGETENLWEPLDYGSIDTSGIPDTLRSEYAIGNSTYGIILAYSEPAVGEAKPRNWKDFWNTEQFPGRRGLFDGPRYSLEAALIADGVAPEDLYPLDVDRAFASLDKIKDEIHVWWQQWPQVPVLLSSQELAMSLTSHTRIASVRKEENAPLDIAWGGGLMTVDFLAVPKNSKNRENAMRLINWMSDPERQAKLAQVTGIGPANTNAFKYLSEEERDGLPIYRYEQGELILFDNSWWAENEQAMVERWNSWKLR